MEDPNLLTISDLRISYPSVEGPTFSTGSISLEVGASEIVGLQGPSGSGKTSLALAVLGILPPHARILSGRVDFKGLSLLEQTERTLRTIRGRRIGLVFQEPLAALNPLLTVGDQVSEALRAHDTLGRADARRHAAALLAEVGLERPETLQDRYPHQLSGGQRQRVLIAAALSGGPELLLCDEPTAALDHPHQLKVLDLLADLRCRRRLSILLIPHSSRVVEYLADRSLRMPDFENAPTANR